VLSVPVGYFYEGVGDEEPRQVSQRERMMLEIARNFAEITNERHSGGGEPARPRLGPHQRAALARSCRTGGDEARPAAPTRRQDRALARGAVLGVLRMRILAAFSVALLLAGCANYGPRSSAAAPSAPGSRLRRLEVRPWRRQARRHAGGTVIGALLGSSAGRSLDRADRYPDSGGSGSEMPRQGDARRGRRRLPRIRPDGDDQRRGARRLRHACRQPDGSWQVVN